LAGVGNTKGEPGGGQFKWPYSRLEKQHQAFYHFLHIPDGFLWKAK